MKKIFKLISISTVLVFGGFIFSLSKQIGGYRAFVVMSPSMEPNIPVGSLVIVHKTLPYDLSFGDVVTFIRPTGEREFITHRIVNISTLEGGVPVFKTKGDNNNNIDDWTLVGGGVVGKVVTFIPTLGYLFSLAKTKIGIAILIILPSVWIIVDEAIVIVKTLKSRGQDNKSVSLSIIILGVALTFSIPGTYALLSDNASLFNNQFTVASLPSPLPSPQPTPPLFPSPTPCKPGSTIFISGNGTGSQNTVVVNSNCSTTTTQSNQIGVITVIDVSTNSGDNESSGNTGGEVNVESGPANTDAEVIVSDE